MKYLIIIAILIISTSAMASDWTWEDTGLQVVITGLYAVDCFQTIEIAKSDNHYERSPILGTDPNPDIIIPYFIVLSAGSCLLNWTLPLKLRRFMQSTFIGVESGATANNYMIGIRIGF